MLTNPRSFRLAVIFVLTYLASMPVFAGNVQLMWDANTDAGLGGYKVYYGAAPRSYGAPVNAGNQTSYQLTGLGPGTYYLAVTAYDTSGNESGYSNEVSTTISGCTYSISPGSLNTSSTTASGNVTVTSSAGCAWTGVSNASWITITAGSSGTGSGSVNYAVAANPSGSVRTGSVTIGGQSFTITQQGNGCDVNVDGSTNALDLQREANVILGTQACPVNCDTNRDGRVDVLDLQTLGNVVLGLRNCP